MALRSSFGCLAVLTLALLACGDEKKAEKAKPTTPPTAAIAPEQRCDQLAKACGDTVKHIEKILEECRAAATAQVDKACIDKAHAAYDCYERELCGQGNPIWALDDFGVLAARHKKCEAEHAAARDCAAPAK